MITDKENKEINDWITLLGAVYNTYLVTLGATISSIIIHYCPNCNYEFYKEDRT